MNEVALAVAMDGDCVTGLMRSGAERKNFLDRARLIKPKPLQPRGDRNRPEVHWAPRQR